MRRKAALPSAGNEVRGALRRHTTNMIKVAVAAIVLLVLFAYASTALTAQEEAGQEIVQKISKMAKKSAPLAKVEYDGSPRFISIDGTSITYAENARQPVLHIGSAFYFLFTYFNPHLGIDQNVWLTSASAQGPWILAHSLPQITSKIVCSQLNAPRVSPYQLCVLPWKSQS
jgi:hypothetical protein